MGGLNAGQWDLFVTKFTSNGTIEWTRQLGNDQSNDGGDVTVGPVGNIYTLAVERDAFDLQIVKHDPDGNLLWDQMLRSPLDELPRGIETDQVGSLYVLGTTALRKFTPAGELVWHTHLEGTLPGDAKSISLDDAGVPYVIGRNFINIYDANTGGLVDEFSTNPSGKFYWPGSDGW